MEMMTSNELKNSLVELLCDFDLFARKNNLRYSLAYGTLLGSIRHQGFIPWDDDIDLWMPRPDFERMLSIPYVGEVDVCLKSHLNGRFLFPYAKLTRADVEIDDPFWNSCGKQELIHRHISVGWTAGRSVFCRASLPRGAENKKRHCEKRCWYRFRKISIQKDSEASVYRFTRRQAMADAKLRKDAVALECLSLRRFDHGGNVRISHPRLIEIMEKSDFETAISKGKFEGRDFPIPGNWDPILECLYGDYMTPPRSQRSGHGLKAYKVALSQVEKQR